MAGAVCVKCAVEGSIVVASADATSRSGVAQRMRAHPIVMELGVAPPLHPPFQRLMSGPFVVAETLEVIALDPQSTPPNTIVLPSGGHKHSLVLPQVTF